MAVTTPAPELARCVLLDANQWRAQYGLRSHLGAALLFLIRQNKALLVLPEVVESEIDRLLVAEGRKAVQQIHDALRVLQTITGSHPSVTLPGPERLAESVTGRLRELHTLLLRVPITVDHARRALARVNARQSPNRKREQFKDSLIWEAARSVASASDLYLVTEDAAFFAPDGRSMADDLAHECVQDHLSITLVRDVRQLLEAFRTTAPALDYELIARQTYEQLSDYLEETVGRDISRWACSKSGTFRRSQQRTTRASSPPMSSGGRCTVTQQLMTPALDDSSCRGKAHSTLTRWKWWKRGQGAAR